MAKSACLKQKVRKTPRGSDLGSGRPQLIERTVRLESGRSIFVSLLRGAPRARRWVVFLPGSAPERLSACHPDLVSLLPRANQDFNFMVLNKSRMSSTRERRIADIVSPLSRFVPKGHEVTLVGYSEGAYVAPDVALASPRQVTGLILLAGGTRGWIEEEVRRMSTSEAFRSLKEISAILSQRTPNKVWRGHHHSTWFSFETDRTAQSLRRLNSQILYIAGGEDELVDVTAAVADLRALKKDHPSQISIRVLRGLNHDFCGRWDLVGRWTRRFLRQL